MPLILSRMIHYWPFYTFLIMSLAIVFSLPWTSIQISQSILKKVKNRTGEVQLLVSATGSPLENVLSNLLLLESPSRTIKKGEVEQLLSDLPMVAPIHVQHFPGNLVIGTDLNYFSFFDLSLASGGLFQPLGSAVVGSSLASQMNLSIGKKFTLPRSSPIVNLGNRELAVAGILKPNFSPIDRAVIVSLETLYLMEGHRHRHQVGKKTIQHGNLTNSELPITAVMVGNLPLQEKLLLKQKIKQQSNLQVVQPNLYLENLIKKNHHFYSMSKGIIFLLLLGFFGILSLLVYLFCKTRTSEIRTLKEIGLSPSEIKSLIFMEILTVACLAGFCCFLITWGMTNTILHTMGL